MLSSQFHWWIYCEFRVIARLCCLWQHLDTEGTSGEGRSWISAILEFCRLGDMRVKRAEIRLYWQENNWLFCGNKAKERGGKWTQEEKAEILGRPGWSGNQRSWGPRRSMSWTPWGRKLQDNAVMGLGGVQGSSRQYLGQQGLNCHKRIYLRNYFYLFICLYWVLDVACRIFGCGMWDLVPVRLNLWAFCFGSMESWH